MRDDILLTPDGDLFLTADGDIRLTESIRQAIIIRLKWFFQEWRFAPSYGVPYFEDILIKNPNISKIRALIRAEIMSVDGVSDVDEINIKTDNFTRNAVIIFQAQTTDGIIREEVEIWR